MKDTKAKELDSELLNKVLGGKGMFCPLCGSVACKEDYDEYSCECGWSGHGIELK